MSSPNMASESMMTLGWSEFMPASSNDIRSSAERKEAALSVIRVETLGEPSAGHDPPDM